MFKAKKRILSLILSLVMLVTTINFNVVFANDFFTVEIANEISNFNVLDFQENLEEILEETEDSILQNIKEKILLVEDKSLSKSSLTTNEKLSKINEVTSNISSIYSSMVWQDSNYLEWFLMNVVANGEHKVSSASINNYIYYVKNKVNDPSTSVTDLEKMTIILTALGYDARNIVDINGNKVNLIEKISNSNITSVSGAIFAISAYDSGDYEVTTGFTREVALKYLVENRQNDGGWSWDTDKNAEFDIDTTGMALVALANYSDKIIEGVKIQDVINTAVELLSNIQDATTGAFGSYSLNSCSTSMVIVGLSAIGIDADTNPLFIKNGNSAIDALLAFVTDNNQFKNNYDDESTYVDEWGTEQGFRALISYKNFVKNNKAFNLYVFSKVNENTPGIGVNDVTPPNVNSSAGSGSNSGNSGTQESAITVSFKLIGDTNHGSPENHTNFVVWIDTTYLAVPKDSTVKYAFEKALDSAGISYVNKDGYYIQSINGLAEFDNGPNSGWTYTVNGNRPSVGFNDYVLKNGDSIIWQYTDDYTKGVDSSGSISTNSSLSYESSSISNSNNLSPINTESDNDLTAQEKLLQINQDNNIILNTLALFNDIPETHFALQYIYYLAERGVLYGRGEGEFAPNDKITIAEFVSILYRASGDRVENVSSDLWYAEAVNFASANNIIGDISETQFNPNQFITREQIAAMLIRFTEYKNFELPINFEKIKFQDSDSISDYALEDIALLQQAGIIVGRGNNEFVPKDNATRGEAAKMVAILIQEIQN